MGSSDRLFNRQRTVHQILGGGLDVMLWRNRNRTVGILVVTLAAWMVFEISCYTLLTLVSSVLLLLFTILLLWAKSAAILNRLSVSADIAYGRDSRMFAKVGLTLLMISVSLTLSYIWLVMLLTVPAFYEKYEDRIDMYALVWFGKLHQFYVRFDECCINWILEKKKLS